MVDFDFFCFVVLQYCGPSTESVFEMIEGLNLRIYDETIACNYFTNK